MIDILPVIIGGLTEVTPALIARDLPPFAIDMYQDGAPRVVLDVAGRMSRVFFLKELCVLRDLQDVFFIEFAGDAESQDVLVCGRPVDRLVEFSPMSSIM